KDGDQQDDEAGDRARGEQVQLRHDDAEEDEVGDAEPERPSELLQPGPEEDEELLAVHGTRRCGGSINRYAALPGDAFSGGGFTAEPSYRLGKIVRAFARRASDESRHRDWRECALAVGRDRGGGRATEENRGDIGRPRGPCGPRP